MGELLTLARVQAGLERAGATVEVLEGFLRVGLAVPTAQGLWGLVVLVESTSEGDLLAVAPGVAAVPGHAGEDPVAAEIRALRLVNGWNASKLWPKLYVDDEVQDDGGRMLVGECWVPFPNGVDDALLDQTLSIVMAELRSAVEALATETETRPVALIEEHLLSEAVAATGEQAAPAAGLEPEPGAVSPETPGGEPVPQPTTPAPAPAGAPSPAAPAGAPAGALEGLAGWLGFSAPSASDGGTTGPGEPIGTWSLSDLVLGGAANGTGAPAPQQAAGAVGWSPEAGALSEPSTSATPVADDAVVGPTEAEAARASTPPSASAPVTAAPAPVAPTPLGGGSSAVLSPTTLPPTVASAVAPPVAPPAAPAPTAQPQPAQPQRPLLFGQVSTSPSTPAKRPVPGEDDDPEIREAERQFREAMALRAQIVEVLDSGDLVRARAMLEQAVPVFRDVGLEPQAMLFEVTLGEVCRDLGDLDAALAAMRRGWAWFHDRKEIFEADLARVEQSLATTLLRVGQLDEARAFFESARTSYVRRSLPEEVAQCDRELGAIALRTGAFDEARQRFQSAESRFARLGLAPEGANARLALGMACALQGDFAEAERAYGAARETFVALGDEANVAECDFGLGVVAIRTGRPSVAAAHYARARATLEALGRAVEVANCDRELAVAALAVGDLDQARQRYTTARAAFAALGRERDVAVCDEGLRAIAARTGATT